MIGPPRRPPPRAVMYIYPWDAWDEGIDAVADQLHGCGVDAVQIAVSYHIATYLLPRNPRRVLYCGDHGALYYQPSPAAARASGVSPIVSQVLGDADALRVILEGFERAGLARIAWMVYAYNHALARARPDLSVRNVFGDHSQAQLCTANPAFRRYALAITDEALERFPFEGLVAESLSSMPYDYGLLNPKLGVAPSRAAAFLLGVCWCDACMHAAVAHGVAAQRLAEAVRRWLRDHLNALPDGDIALTPVEAVLGGAFGEDLRAYRSLQAELTTDLHREVLGLAARRGLSVGSTTVEQGRPWLHTGVSAETVAPLVDDARLSLEPGVSVATVAERARALRDRLPALQDVYGLVQVERFESRRALDGVLEAAAAAGLQRFRIYNYGLLTETQVGWLVDSKPAWA